MNKFIKKLLSFSLCAAMMLFHITSAYAVAEKTNIFFFGKSSVSGDSLTFPKKIGEYLKEEYRGAVVNDWSDVGEGFKSAFEKLENNNLIPDIGFFTFNGSETETQLAYAEGIIRKLQEKNNSLTVNFIILPDGKENTDISEILKISEYYEIFVHNLRDKEILLKEYGKFNFNELFLNSDMPNEKGHDVIARTVINDLKTENRNKTTAYRDNAIYAEIISGFGGEEAVNVVKTKKEIYCDVNGNDENSGTMDNPYKSIEKVMEEIAALPENTNITVYFREGSYNIGTGIVIDSEITKNKKITFSAYNNEKVMLTNSYKVDKSLLKTVTDKEVLKRLPEESRGRVLQLNLNDCGLKDEGGFVRHGVWQGTPSAFQLIVGDKIQSISRWPNSGFENILSPSGRTITVDTDRIERWQTATESWLYGYLGNYFADDSIAITKIDAVNKTITVANDPRYAFAADHSWSVINLLEEIDVPGEWFLDHGTNILYYFPVDGFENKEVRLSTKTDVLFTLNNTKDITFKGLIFDGTRGVGLQMNECDNTLIEDCEIRNTGRNAVNLTGRNNVVRNCYVHDTGRGGVWITGGGDIKTLTKSNNLIEYCRFENVSNYARTYVPAIELYGVGDRAAHNQISSGLGIAIDFKGKKNIIEYNEIFNYLFEGGDIGTIYCGRSWTTVGTEIRYNYIHDCPGAGDVQAIYLDDGMTGVSVYGNVIENLTRGIYLHFGSYNNVYNNVFADCDIAVVIRNPMGITDQAAESANKEIDAAFENGTDTRYDKYGFQTKYSAWRTEYLPNAAVWDAEYPHVKNSPHAGLFSPKDNIFERNIYACRIDYNMSDAMKPNQTFKDNYSLSKEELEGFNLATVNEVYGSKIPGFEPVDIKKAGLSEKPELSDVELLEPLNESVNLQALGIDFSWKRVNEAVSYELVVANDKEFSDIVYKAETDKNKAYARLDGLRYGNKTYYWKVIAHGISDNEKESGVYSFTTAQKENVDKKKLRSEIQIARNAYETSVEGDKPGETIIGARDILNKYILSAERVFESKSATQKNVDKAHETLLSQIKKFNASKNYITAKVGIGEMLSKENAWAGIGEIYEFKNGNVKLKSNGSIGYTGHKIENHQIMKFKLKLSDVKGSNWISFGVRAKNVEVQPWNTPCYVFLVKEDVVELQKFNGGKSFYLSTENKYLKNDEEHEIEFGAVTMGDEKSVRVILIIDGVTVFDYIDSEDQVGEAGFFSVYSAGGKAEISVSDELK